jgi:hypothetical protein
MTDEPEYYGRTPTLLPTGQTSFATKEDDEAEAMVAERIKQSWAWDCRKFGKFTAIDWYAIHKERMVALLELKNRRHKSTDFKTVYLNARKWIALTMGALGHNVPAIFVARFTDGKVLYVPVASIDATQHKMGGTMRIVKAENDWEPVIEVPIANMKALTDGRPTI